MNRRGFLSLVAVAPFARALKLPPKAPSLAFHPKAFEMTMEPLVFDPPIIYAYDQVTGVRMRLISGWAHGDVIRVRPPRRFAQ